MDTKVTKEGNLQEYLSEGKLYTFEPNSQGAMCWLTLEDVPNKKKANTVLFETFGKRKRYMTPVQKNGRDYAKIYIVGAENVTIVYVEKYAVCQGTRVYRK